MYLVIRFSVEWLREMGGQHVGGGVYYNGDRCCYFVMRNKLVICYCVAVARKPTAQNDGAYELLSKVRRTA